MPRATVRLAESRLYTVRDAATFFAMSVSWVRERIKAGDLDGYLCGNLLISGASMNRYLASRAIGPRITQTPTENGNIASVA